jgi:hypothetical protein
MVEAYSRYYPDIFQEGLWKSRSNSDRIDNFPVEIRIEYLPNTNLERYRYASLLSRSPSWEGCSCLAVEEIFGGCFIKPADSLRIDARPPPNRGTNWVNPVNTLTSQCSRHSLITDRMQRCTCSWNCLRIF